MQRRYGLTFVVEFLAHDLLDFRAKRLPILHSFRGFRFLMVTALSEQRRARSRVAGFLGHARVMMPDSGSIVMPRGTDEDPDVDGLAA